MKAIYAASLDPITNGHVNVIERAAPLFDHLVVVVAVDSRKSYAFSPEERVALARESVAHLSNVSVEKCVGVYVVKYGRSIGASAIVRGLRTVKDLEDELVLAEENRKICPEIETVWIPCHPNLMHVSSSMVKGHVGVDPGWEKEVARSVPEHVVAKLKEKHMTSKARKYWGALMKALGSPEGSDEVFADLVARYSEEHRGYHTLEHIVRMLDEFEDVRHLASDPSAVGLATWFHDAVYDVGAKDPKAPGNEEMSARLARVALKKLGLPEALVIKVERMILATLHHNASDDPDEKLMLDLDMAILGAPADDFDRYEAGVRKEYGHVSAEAFAFGRSKFLRSTLDRSEIYTSAFFHDRYNKSARENLERALARL